MSKFWLVAGHGQGDPGAVCGSRKESEYTRALCYDILDYCSDFGINITLYDPTKDLYQTREYGRFAKDDQVLEVHFNAYNKTAYGTELLIHSNFKADSLDTSINKLMGGYFYNRGIKGRNDLANMNNFKTKGTAYRLLEVCFIDYEADMNIYHNKYNQIFTGLGQIIVNSQGKGSQTVEKPNTGSTGYLVVVNTKTDPLNIRAGAGTSYKVVGSIPKDGKKYTIVEEKNGFGKLKSGAGWVSLAYVKRV